MCKPSPGKRCSSHVLEKINTLETNITELEENVRKLDHKLKVNRDKDSNYDETEEGALVVQARKDKHNELKAKNQQLHEERASFYITDTGQQHLQDIIDDPDSSAKEVMEALMHNNTAAMRKGLDQEIMAIVKNEKVSLETRYRAVTNKVGKIESEIKNIEAREEKIHENLAKAEQKAEDFQAKGMTKEAAEWTKTARLYKQEAKYLESYKNQLASFASNVNKWQERTAKSIDENAEKAIDTAFDGVEKSVEYAALLW